MNITTHVKDEIKLAVHRRVTDDLARAIDLVSPPIKKTFDVRVETKPAHRWIVVMANDADEAALLAENQFAREIEDNIKVEATFISERLA